MDYTKGEWKASKTINFTGTLVSYITCGDKYIARTSLSDIGFTKEENEANAHLMAAAPELYDALELLQFALQGAVDCDPAYWTKVRLALAKAEGK